MTTTATTYAKRPARYIEAAESHICTRCVLPGDQLEITGPASVLLIATIREFIHPVVPAGETWLLAETATGRGFTLEWRAWCPFDPMPGSLLTCGCWMQANGDAVLCTTHESEAVDYVNTGGAA